MKKIIFIVAIAATVATTSFTSCSSSQQKVENAENKVENAKENLKEVIKESDITAQKIATADEWKMFKNDAEAIISNNEIKIGNLKTKIKKPASQSDASFISRINALEQQNHNLKLKIDTYDKNHSDWELFKNEFNRDMEGLGKAFKDLTIKNKN